jgi:parallel beta-helix repeat protein
VTETSISVAWSASVDNVKVVGYTLYRDGASVGSTGGTSYSFSGLACGKSYALAVDAYDAAGNHSSRSQLNAATDACSAPPPPPSGPAFYVAPSGSDSNAGTLQSPWRTIGKAMASVGPGQIAYLRAGTYVEATGGSCGSGYNTLVWSSSGNASAPIVISGYPGEESSVIVKTKLKLSGNWLVVRGLVVDRNTAYSSFDNACTGEPNVNVYGDDDVVQRLDIRNSNMSGIFLSGADRVRIEGNAIHDNGQHAALDHGIYYGSGVGGTISNNLIERNKAFGIQMYPHPSGQTISSNTIVGSGKAGMVLDGASGLVVANNISAWNAEQGIRTGGSGCAGCTATTNVLFGNSADYYLPGPLAALATIHADPMFLNRAAGDLRVDSTSPAVDTGLSSYAPTTDFAGTARPQGRGPDIGAYER